MGFYNKNAAQCIGALGCAGETVVAFSHQFYPVGRYIETFTIVGDVQACFFRIERETHAYLRGLRVPYDVVHGLLKDPEQCQPYFFRQQLMIAG